MDDRREYNRTEFGVNVEYKLSDGQFIKFARLSNMSPNGCLIQTNKEVSLGSQIVFRFEDDEQFYLAKVVWCQKTPVYIGNKEKYDIGLEYNKAINKSVKDILENININVKQKGIKRGSE